MGDMHVVIGIAAAHVERIVRAGGAVQPEIDEKALHLVQIRSAEAREGEVVDFDQRLGHVIPPARVSR